MMLIEPGAPSLRAFDAQLIVAAQLSGLGYDVAIDAATAPEDLDRGRTYEAAPYLRDADDLPPATLFLVGAEELGDATLQRLRASPAEQVIAIGRFASPQDEIGARAKLAYASGREPVTVNLSELQPRPFLPGALAPLCAETTSRPPSDKRPTVTIALGANALDAPEALPYLSSLGYRQAYQFVVVANAEQKDQIRASRFHDLSVVTFTELSPVTLAARTDIFAVYGQGVPGERMAAMAVCLMAAGGIVVDCTQDGALLVQGAPVLRGPENPAALDAYLTDTVLPNVSQIAEQVAQSPWLASADIARLEAAAGLERPAAPRKTPKGGGRIVFMPTNGIGLGHAQRCTVIADALARPETTAFAAFPSCVPMILGRGYDCMPLVQKSPFHAAPYANDVTTYQRLSHLLGPGDRLVFDGGYVFDSIFRTVQERGVPATWIRRGLWPEGRASDVALDRERIFDQVIVPAEAFPELNDVYSSTAAVHHVGPIVRPAPKIDGGPEGLRARLAAHFDRPFEQLVVSMLGGGVASDRTAQLQAISAMLARRPGVLHLIVVWPGANVPAALHAWPGTRVVQTFEALSLCLAADLTISAAGYNSVHEILYHQLPAILMPQTAPYLDDQTRRAQALADRELCTLVADTEILQLERAIAAYLEGDAAARAKAALAVQELPAPGAGDAARLIAGQAERAV